MEPEPWIGRGRVLHPAADQPLHLVTSIAMIGPPGGSAAYWLYFSPRTARGEGHFA
jgi:hypothetical protein